MELACAVFLRDAAQTPFKAERLKVCALLSDVVFAVGTHQRCGLTEGKCKWGNMLVKDNRGESRCCFDAALIPGIDKYTERSVCEACSNIKASM